MKPTADLDSELARLKEASERVAANLVELEIDSSRQLLETSHLSGERQCRLDGRSRLLDLFHLHR